MDWVYDILSLFSFQYNIYGWKYENTDENKI